VLRTPAGRHGLELTETPLGALATNGAGPAGDGVAEASAIGLDRDSVVLLVGGARGITAKFAVALAAASRCRIELLGRTAAPAGPEDPATAGARTPAELRAALAAKGGGLTPAEINRTAELLLAQREITATLDELAALGSQARYHSVDFREPDAALQAVKEIHAEHGRLDGVVYAAGVIEDRLIAEKTTESFQRVYGTKTHGAETCCRAGGTAQRPFFRRAVRLHLGSPRQPGPGRLRRRQRRAAESGHRLVRPHRAPCADRALGSVGAHRWPSRHGHPGVGTRVRPARYLADRPRGGHRGLLRELAWGDESAGAVVYTASGW
jgi:NAD(P)-dependent dehydrogenase (short-subunit alcohol dehydrogenase family)